MIYIVNIIEKLSVSARDDNGIHIPGVTVERLKKGRKWMLTLQSVYRYGPNEKIGDEYSEENESRVVGNKFLLLHDLQTSRLNNSKLKLNNCFWKENQKIKVII